MPLPQMAIAVIVEGDLFIAVAVGWGLDFLGSLILDVMVFYFGHCIFILMLTHTHILFRLYQQILNPSEFRFIR